MWSDSDECSDTSASDWTCECCPGCPYGNLLPERAHSRIYSSNTVDKNWSIIVEINEKPYRERVPYRRRKNFIRSSCANILVKVESDLYHLDRVQLALKSDYFEKLFASDFYEKHKEMMEIQAVDSEIFSNVLDIIYGVNLAKVLCVDNYAGLLVAMDYFQMEINLEIFLDFLKLNIEVPLCEFPGICELYDYTAENRNFEYFSPTLRQYLSIHLIEVIDSDEFAELSLASLVKIIKNDKFPWYNEEKCIIGEICAKWICHDVGDRLIHLTDLVNAAKNRYDFPFEIRADDSIVRHLLDINEESTRRAEVAKHFEYLLEFNTEISPGLVVYGTTRAKWDFSDQVPSNPKSFSFQCQDQMVKVGSNIYHIDRFRSALKSNYFEKLFSSGDFAEKNDKVCEIELNNSEVFPAVIDLIHGKKLIDVLNKDNYIPLLKAMDHFKLEIDLDTVERFLNNESNLFLMENAKVFELYAFIRNNSKFDYLLENIIKYFANPPTTIRNHEIFPFVPLKHLIRIIQSVQNVDDEKRYQIVEMCAEWLCHDFERRIRHLTILINSIKPEFHSETEKDAKDDTPMTKCLPKTMADEQAEKKTVMKCVFALLAHGGKLNPSIVCKDNLDFSEKSHEYDTDYEDFAEMKKEEYDEYSETNFPKIANENNLEDKLRKFLRDGDFYDITVRVGEKTYKLHRTILESKCGYFADIFRSEYAEAIAKSNGIPACPSKDNEYLLDGVDQSTFDNIIHFIYFYYYRPDWNRSVGIFKTANVLKIHNILENLAEHLKKMYIERKFSSSDVDEILNIVHGKKQYDGLYQLYFCEYLNAMWPNINVSRLCSISHNMLKYVSDRLAVNADDPFAILDICSTWVVHDAKNRFRFLPGIARAINPHCEIDEDKFIESEASVDLNDCSKQFIRDKLWKILSKISYIIPADKLAMSKAKEFAGMSVFIATKDNEKLDVLNADLDEIASFSSAKESDSLPRVFCLERASATMINDNLFVFTVARFLKFMVYNFRLKRVFILPVNLNEFRERSYLSHSHFSKGNDFTLLNCNNEIYCCSIKGLVAKFSMQLNRWMIISIQMLDKESVLYTSDGETLYRMYKESKQKYIVEAYNFEKKLWSRPSSLPLIENITAEPHQVTIANGRDLAVLTFADIILFNRESMKWRYYKIPYELWKETSSNLFVECEGNMLIVIKNKLYNFSRSNGDFKFVKDLPSEYRASKYHYQFQYGKILSIHKRAICTN